MKRLWINRLDCAVVIAVGLCLGILVTSAESSFYTSILAEGQNTFEDQNREAYVDVDGDGKLSVGDVLLGFVRLDDHQPIVSGVGSINDRIYAIFSQQVTNITLLTGPGGNPVFGQVDFGPTTATGLKLSDIVSGAPANGIIALFSSPVPITNLINISPGDTTVNGYINLFDYFKLITANMSLDAVAGISQPDDYFTATTSSPSGLGLFASGGAATIPNIEQGVTVANFHAGLTIVLNNNPVVIYNETVLSTNLTLHELVIKNGSVSGMKNATNSSEWSSILPDLNAYYAGKNPGGFITDADFLVNVTVIPEPGMFAILVSFVTVGSLGFAIRRPGWR